MPKNTRPPTQFDFDLICIGSGSTGGSVAVMAAKAGLKVALIEGAALGGESSNYSCVPINACLQVVKKLDTVATAFSYGIDTGRVFADWKKVMAFKNKCVADTGAAESAGAFEKAGISVINGFAKFIDPWTVNVNRRQITAQKMVIATGAGNFIPNIRGLNSVEFITYKEALKLPELPESVFIIGGGMTGCALAEIFSSFGSRVYLAEATTRLLPREDVEVGQIQAEIFKTKNIKVLLGSAITKVSETATGQKEVTLQEGEDTKRILVAKLIVAAGRTPQLDLNLPAAGVQFTDSGIKVNRYLETTAGHIYAGGDTIGYDMLTHLAAYHAKLIAHNLQQSRKKDKTELAHSAITRHLGITPEMAATGLTEAELQHQGLPYKKAIAPLHDLAISSLSGQQTGFVKLLATPEGRLIGGSIIAPNAGEMIAQVNLAINAKLSSTELKNNLKAFATWSEALNAVCLQLK